MQLAALTTAEPTPVQATAAGPETLQPFVIAATPDHASSSLLSTFLGDKCVPTPALVFYAHIRLS